MGVGWLPRGPAAIELRVRSSFGVIWLLFHWLGCTASFLCPCRASEIPLHVAAKPAVRRETSPSGVGIRKAQAAGNHYLVHFDLHLTRRRGAYLDSRFLLDYPW